MHDHIATLVYTQLDDFYQSQIQRLKLPNYGRLDSKLRLAGAKITLPEAACLAVLFQSSRIEHFKTFIDCLRPTLPRLFPKLPSYPRLCQWLKKSEQLLLGFVESNKAEPGSRLDRYAIDSTKIDPHKDKNSPKSLRAATGAGRTHEGWFIGFKLHVLVDMHRRIVRIDLTPGNHHDLDPVKAGILKGVRGVVFGDSGYVSGEVKELLRTQDIALVAKPTKAMVDELWLFDRIWGCKAKGGGEYRKRQTVEGVFSVLKRCFGLQSRSCRCASTLRSRIWASLAGYMLAQK